MSAVWIITRTTKTGARRYQVRYRLGGREAPNRYGGSFKTRREARARERWIEGELAAMRVPDLANLVEPATAATFADTAKRWQASRVDVRESTAIQHRTALGRVSDRLNATPVDNITPAALAELVADLDADGKARESIRKTRTAIAMVLDFAGVSPNPARDRITVRLLRSEREEPEPPDAATVEAVAHVLTPAYMVGLLVLDATGCRIGELEAAEVGDLDEERRAWLIRARVAKTKTSPWAHLPDDLFEVVLASLPPREDRDPAAPLFAGVTADRLRVAIGRACKLAAVSEFSPHDLRHRLISLLHRQGLDWATIGARVGQRNLLTTAQTYTHAMIDGREVDRSKLLKRVRVARQVGAPVGALSSENRSFAGMS
jgi:integrase